LYTGCLYEVLAPGRQIVLQIGVFVITLPILILIIILEQLKLQSSNLYTCGPYEVSSLGHGRGHVALWNFEKYAIISRNWCKIET